MSFESYSRKSALNAQTIDDDDSSETNFIHQCLLDLKNLRDVGLSVKITNIIPENFNQNLKNLDTF